MKFLKIALLATFFTSILAATAHAGIYSKELPEFVTNFAPVSCDDLQSENDRYRCMALKNKPATKSVKDAKKAPQAEEKLDLKDPKNNPLNITEEQAYQELIAPFAPELEGQKVEQSYAKCIFEWCCPWCKRF